jgi:mono/diheme cytochrome c family protein
VSWETILVIRKGANYGYPLREGTQVMSENGMSAVPQDDRIPVHISDTVVRGAVTPTYPVAQFPHTPTGGDAIANGFVYRGKAIPALRNKLLFSDITTARFWYTEIEELIAADDNDPKTVAPILEVDSNLRQLVEDTYRSRGGKTPALPGFARVSGPGRVDVRLATDEQGELYVLTKPDGMIRKIVGASVSARSAALAATPSATPAASSGPVPSSPQSIAAGKKVYDAYCAACHGNAAQGAVRAGIAISIIQEQNRRQPPDLTDAQWDHGSTDADIVSVIKRGVPTTMMPPFDGSIADADVWNIVNYLRSLSPQR